MCGSSDPRCRECDVTCDRRIEVVFLSSGCDDPLVESVRITGIGFPRRIRWPLCDLTVLYGLVDHGGASVGVEMYRVRLDGPLCDEPYSVSGHCEAVSDGVIVASVPPTAEVISCSGY